VEDAADMLVDPDAGPGVTFILAGSTANVGTGCAEGSTQLDLVQPPFTSPGPELTHDRHDGTLVFCSPAFAAGATLAPGTTLVRLYTDKVQGTGSSCRITVTLLVNGTELLGEGTLTLTASEPLARRTVTFGSQAATLSAGDRLNLRLVWEQVKSCGESTVHFAAPDVMSSLHLPPLT